MPAETDGALWKHGCSDVPALTVVQHHFHHDIAVSLKETCTVKQKDVFSTVLFDEKDNNLNMLTEDGQSFELDRSRWFRCSIRLNIQKNTRRTSQGTYHDCFPSLCGVFVFLAWRRWYSYLDILWNVLLEFFYAYLKAFLFWEEDSKHVHCAKTELYHPSSDKHEQSDSLVLVQRVARKDKWTYEHKHHKYKKRRKPSSSSSVIINGEMAAASSVLSKGGVKGMNTNITSYVGRSGQTSVLGRNDKLNNTTDVKKVKLKQWH